MSSKKPETTLGFYDHYFDPGELERLLSAQGRGTQDEISLVKVFLCRVLESVLNQNEIDDPLALLNAIGANCVRITQMMERQRELDSQGKEIDEALAAMQAEVLREMGLTE